MNEFNRKNHNKKSGDKKSNGSKSPDNEKNKNILRSSYLKNEDPEEDFRNELKNKYSKTDSVALTQDPSNPTFEINWDEERKRISVMDSKQKQPNSADKKNKRQLSVIENLAETLSDSPNFNMMMANTNISDISAIEHKSGKDFSRQQTNVENEIKENKGNKTENCLLNLSSNDTQKKGSRKTLNENATSKSQKLIKKEKQRRKKNEETLEYDDNELTEPLITSESDEISYFAPSNKSHTYNTTIKQHRPTSIDNGKQTSAFGLSKESDESKVAAPKRIVSNYGLFSGKMVKNNAVNNRKYSVITFLPFMIYNQFKFFFNFYFLIITCSQFVSIFDLGYQFVYAAPLCCVLFITFLRELYDEIKRYRRDRCFNITKYDVFQKGELTKKNGQDLRPGDIIHLKPGETTPADLVILATNDEEYANVFVKTDQLDGETDWKTRTAIKSCHKYYTTTRKFDNNIEIKVELPDADAQIYDFRGTSHTKQDNGDEFKEPLRLENTIWMGMGVAHGEVCAMVIYLGKETKMQLNKKNPRTKWGKSDCQINNLSKMLFGFLLVISVALELANKWKGTWWLNTFRYLILQSGIIPMSLRVNLDFAKIIFSASINNDKDIEGCKAINTDIPEELGRIEYLLSDKTGTLTQNDMKLRALSTGIMQFSEEEFKDLKVEYVDQFNPFENLSNRYQNVASFVYSMILCNNVTMSKDDQGMIFL